MSGGGAKAITGAPRLWKYCFVSASSKISIGLGSRGVSSPVSG